MTASDDKLTELRQELMAEINTLRGQIILAQEEIEEDVSDEMAEAKEYIEEYLINALDKFLAEKSLEWQKEQNGPFSVKHPKYWETAYLGFSVIISPLALPFWLAGIIVAKIRNLKSK